MTEPTMSPEAVETIKTKLQVLTTNIGNGVISRNTVLSILGEAIGMIPEPKPKPAAAPGPYGALVRYDGRRDTDVWDVLDVNGELLVVIDDEPTAKLLALSWKMRELLDGVRIAFSSTGTFLRTKVAIDKLLASLEVAGATGASES